MIRRDVRILAPLLGLTLFLLAGCSNADREAAGDKTSPAQPAAAPAPEKAAPAPTPPKAPSLPSFDGEDIAVAAIDDFIAQSAIDTSKPRWKNELPKPPQVTFDGDKKYFWYLDTNMGRIKIKLMPEVAPMHVSSTIYLTRLGFYDEVLFHRVIPRFMAQGGDPDGTGRGGPGYKYAGEFDPSVRHDRPGLLSMANAGPGTDGSQFFLTFVPTPHLDGKHTIFGEVVMGTDTLAALEARGSRGGRTRGILVINSATVDIE